ncbi:MAG: fused MFS/spermidine synthase [Candidatus Scalindua sp.]|nr:fused MFS/spermidine synthase [Candidatus Scalindua sp.]MBT5307499.1 fused MFS/spermidine synthase [Candidatus Scalindua sp.]MBT6048011.1 fused MFS/spermidine synthase [Candidatus Scalindua sp.]MBT6228127.1 fused MFS/spermidine synthase [Candidatus Scalindua sp.]MBT7213152.1 fused MFS/spermidine synthase [Candidatus Scalindua sp.]
MNPQVEAIARKYFNYLKKCKGKVDVVIGDARISLERELLNQGPLRYDIMALDAFSGDAIPIHLLTREAFDLYWKHLKSDGILAIHISNAYLDLKPVVNALARESGMRTILIEDDGNILQRTVTIGF